MGGIHWIIIIDWKELVWIEVGVIVRPIRKFSFPFWDLPFTRLHGMI